MAQHHHQISRKIRLRAVIAISFCFFLTEISVGFYTRSLALVADAFHYLNDLIGFIVALVAVQMMERKTSPQYLSFGWARAQLLGAFFNGVFLFALGLSIFLQSIERFISLESVENPKLVLVVGCIGLFLNLISALVLHEHDHDHNHDQDHHSHIAQDDPEIRSTPAHASHMHLLVKPTKHSIDLGIMGVLIHILGDAINNMGVIIAAVIIWLLKSPTRFYADPAVSLWIAMMILTTAIPLTKRSGKILLQSVPLGVRIEDIKHDLESIPGVQSVHELHVWCLDQRKAIASAHVVVNDSHLERFMEQAKTFSHCLHAYGIHSATLQPELAVASQKFSERDSDTTVGSASTGAEKCALPCKMECEELRCCS